MIDRSSLELRVVEKLRTLSAVKLQWLAEDIAVVRDRNRYINLIAKGRNAEAQTTKGWPDAFVPAADGSVDGVEATRDRNSWTQHLEADLEKAESPDHPNLNGYLFVAGYPDHAPNEEELGCFLKRFSDLGIAEERISFLVGKGLVRELLQPQYARVLTSVLGLSHVPEFFELVREERAPGRREWAFAPTAAEFGAGLVHRPALADEVESHLDREGFAVLRGRGAAGKTVLAQLIAAAPRSRALPSYYLNIAPLAGQVDLLRGRIGEVFASFGGEGVIFILDNIHLEEEFAFDAFHEWKEIARPSGTRLMLVGREVKSAAGSLFEQTGISSLILQAGRAEMRGVYRRLASREFADGLLPEPPKEALLAWETTFGGGTVDESHSVDLMAFSAAVENRLPHLLRSNWHLGAEHAQSEVRKYYLAPLTADERANLLRLAALPEDCFLAYESLAAPYAGFSHCVQIGLVFETTHGTDNQIRYSLVHSALGRLILAAASPQVNRKLECRAAAVASSFNGFLIAKYAEELGEPDLASSVYASIAANQHWLSSLPTAQHLSINIERARTFGVELLPQSQRLAAWTLNELVEVALRTPLHFLVTFLKYAQTQRSGLKELHTALVKQLKDHSAELGVTALKTPLNDLVTFLKYAQTQQSGLKELHTALVKQLKDHSAELGVTALKTPLDQLVTFLKYAQTQQSGLTELHTALVKQLKDHSTELGVTAVKTPLHFLVTFLKYAQTQRSGLKELHTALVKQLKDHSAELGVTALKTPLNDLVTFLKYAQTQQSGLKELHTALVKQLKDHSAELGVTALKTPLDQLVTFLKYAQTQQSGLTELHTALVKQLKDHSTELGVTAVKTPLHFLVTFLKYAQTQRSGLTELHTALVKQLKDHSAELGVTAVKTPLDHLLAFLTYTQTKESGFSASDDNFAASVLESIDTEAWNSHRLALQFGQPSFALSLARVFTKLGRPDLMVAPVHRLVLKADPEEWQHESVGLQHFSTAIRFSGDLPHGDLANFINKVAKLDFLDRHYSQAQDGSLAAGWLALATNLPPSLHDLFLTDSLTRRLHRSFASLDSENEEGWVAAFAMIGSASIIGANCILRQANWPSSSALKRAVDLRRAEEGMFGILQIQFWSGVREMVRQRLDRVSLSPCEGTAVLDAWRSIEAPTPIGAVVNASMITWLEECETADWVLTQSPMPIREDILARLSHEDVRT